MLDLVTGATVEIDLSITAARSVKQVRIINIVFIITLVINQVVVIG